MSLYDDVIIKINDELLDKQKIYVSMISKRFDKLKYKNTYTELRYFSEIKSLSYFDNFENVSFDIMTSTYPMYVKFIHFRAQETNNILNRVTHLTFGTFFNEPINNCIPSSVTHLIFGFNFNQPINNCIPSSVTHLTFGHRFNQQIKDCIPSSVFHLTFDWNFNQAIKRIPTSVKKIIISKNYENKIESKIRLHAKIEKDEP
jgi:hypothetical protein